MVDKIYKLLKIRGALKQVLMAFLLVVGIPVAVSLILGYEMQAKQIQHIPTVIVDHDNSAFSRMLVDEIKTNEIFNITNYSDRDETVNELIEKGKVKVGVIIPNSFSKDLKEGTGTKVLIFYDGSQMSIASAAKSRMTEILLTIKTGYLKKLAEGKLGVSPQQSMNAALPMYFKYRLVGNPTKNYINFMLPGMLMAVLQVGFAMIGVARVLGNEKYYVQIWLKSLLWGALTTISTIIVIGIQCKYFGLPYRSSVRAGLVMTFLFCTGMVSFGTLIKLVIPDKMFATQVSAVLVLPSSLLGGYTFPLMAMPPVFQILGKYIPFAHFSCAIRDLCLKDLPFEYWSYDINWQFKFVIIMWGAAFVVFQIKKIVKKIYTNIKNKKHIGENTGQVIEG